MLRRSTTILQKLCATPALRRQRMPTLNNHLRPEVPLQQSQFAQVPARHFAFFSRNKQFNDKQAEKTEKEAAASAFKEATEKDKAETKAQDEATQEEPAPETADPKKEAAKEETKKEEAASSAEEGKEGDSEKKPSSSDSESDDGTLSKEDVKRIKSLFAEQEEEIEALEKKLTKLKEQAKEHEDTIATQKKHITLAKTEYTSQVKENELTVQRYRKMIEDEKSFAISKFAKDLLEVRDAVRMALEHTDLDALMAEEDLQTLRDRLKSNIEGQEMTADVMDRVLGRFKVVQYDPMGETFDPKLHEAVFTVAQSEQENDTIAVVMQTGWKIDARVLRAAKVGIVKK